jgi:flagellar assembly protein FliH
VANSSDWLGALADGGAPPPGWLALLGEAQDFREMLPGVVEAEQPPASEAMAERAPAPVADPAPDVLAQAYADGEAAGRAAALAEAEHHAARQRALRLAFRNLDEAASAALAADLAETVIALCDGVLGAHATDREALIARCHAAAQRIGGAPAALRLHLNPADLDSLGPDALDGWTVIADSTIAPGGLLLEGPDGTLRDGPEDWRRAIAAAVRG